MKLVEDGVQDGEQEQVSPEASTEVTYLNCSFESTGEMHSSDSFLDSSSDFSFGSDTECDTELEGAPDLFPVLCCSTLYYTV